MQFTIKRSFALVPIVAAVVALFVVVQPSRAACTPAYATQYVSKRGVQFSFSWDINCGTEWRKVGVAGALPNAKFEVWWKNVKWRLTVNSAGKANTGAIPIPKGDTVKAISLGPEANVDYTFSR
jgi:hypothetical protein